MQDKPTLASTILDQHGRGYPFEVLLPQGLGVEGAILSDQIESLDWRVRKARRIGNLPSDVLQETVVRFVRRYRREGRFRVLPLIVNAIATVFLVVLPFTRLLGVLTASGSGAPRLLAGFGDWLSG